MKPPFKIWIIGQMKKTAKNAAVTAKTNRAKPWDIREEVGEVLLNPSRPNLQKERIRLG